MTIGSILIFSAHRPEAVEPFKQLIIVLACLGVGGVIALVGIGYLQAYNRVRQMELVPIRQLSNTDGEVELSGTARIHEETSLTPFTESECIAYNWEIKEFSKSSSNRAWSAVHSGGTRHPFRLDDGTGTALVDPNGGTLELLTHETIEVEPDEAPSQAVSDFLTERDDIDREHSRTRRYIEERLEPGEDIHVLGPIRRLAHSVDMPGGADAVIGLDDPDRGFSIDEGGVSALVDQIKVDTMRLIITTGDEQEAERHLLKKGLLIAGFGIVFALIPVGFVVIL